MPNGGHSKVFFYQNNKVFIVIIIISKKTVGFFFALTKDLNFIRVGISYTTFFGKSSRIMMRMCESRRMIIDFCTSSHLITLIMPVGPDVTSWLNATLSLCWVSTSQASAFPLIPISEDQQE